MIDLAAESADNVDPFRTRVRKAANMVRSDTVELDECEAHEANGRTDEEFREAVQERIQDRYVHEVDDEDRSSEETTEDIDWRALYEEFGLDTPDAVGKPYASSVQLTLAIECSEQNIAGNPDSHINEAVKSGALDRMTATRPDNQGECLDGFRLGRVA